MQLPTAAGAGSRGWGEQSLAAHHGRRRARSANRQAERRGPGPRHARTRRRVAEELSGRASRSSLKNADGKKQIRGSTYADNLDAFVYMVLVDADVKNDEMQDFLYRDRTKLAVYAKAMFGLALHKQGDAEKLAMILQNIDQFLVQDDENQTAYLKLPEDNYWWYWYGSEFEANAYYLKLLGRDRSQGRSWPRGW